MPRYGRDYGRFPAGERGRYGVQYENDWGYIAESRRFQELPFGPGERGRVGGQRREYDREEAYGGFPAPFQLRAGGYDRGYQGRGAMYDSEYGRGGYGARSRQRGRVRAAEIMTENPETVTPDDTIDLAARKMRDLDVGILPVVGDPDSRRLVGVVTDRDLTVRAIAEGKGGKTKVRSCMSGEVSTAREDSPVGDLLDIMRTEQVRRVPVVDQEDRLVGIVAQADLAVDYAEGSPWRERGVESAVERISEPARPRRGRGGQRRSTEQ